MSVVPPEPWERECCVWEQGVRDGGQAELTGTSPTVPGTVPDILSPYLLVVFNCMGNESLESWEFTMTGFECGDAA
jgi:hypothetical protein